MMRNLLLVLPVVCLVPATGCLSVNLEDRPCASADECLDTHRCAAGKCRPMVPTSETLMAPDYCHGVYPEEAAAALDAGEDVVLFGTLLPTSGANESKGLAREKAVQLALDELTNLGGVNQAEVGAVTCDSAGDPAQATEAATFLAEYAQVPATIGAALSSVTLEAFQDGAEPSGMLMISPSATSPFLSGLSDLLWRTAPSDAGQGVAIAALLIDEGMTSVAVVASEDAYGEGLRAVVRKEWCVPDGTTDTCQADATKYITRSFPASGDVGAEQDEAVADLIAFDPDAIVVAAQLEGITTFLEKMSGTALATKFIVLPDAAKNDQLLEVDDALLANVFGTGPITPVGANYGAFADSYGENPAPAFTANAYDATWLLAYAAGTTEEVTGEAIRDGLRRLSEGTVYNVGPTDFRDGLQVLTNDPAVTINVQGASGPLDFPTGETEAPADIGGWYVDTGAGALQDYAGVFYDAATGTITNPLTP
jgi:branched-chain amino acid transport system substrate-binding protein